MLPFFYFKTEPPDQSSIADDFRVAFDFVKFLLYYSTLYLYLTWKKMGGSKKGGFERSRFYGISKQLSIVFLVNLSTTPITVKEKNKKKKHCERVGGK